MRMLLTLLVIAYLVGVGVTLAPHDQDELEHRPGFEFVEKIVAELREALSWPVAAYRSVTEKPPNLTRKPAPPVGGVSPVNGSTKQPPLHGVGQGGGELLGAERLAQPIRRLDARPAIPRSRWRGSRAPGASGNRIAAVSWAPVMSGIAWSVDHDIHRRVLPEQLQRLFPG